jgi:hypothetical protein
MKIPFLRQPRLLVALFALIAGAVGCATQPQLYYFGDYSRALYHHKKNPTPETLAAYETSLRKVIQTSSKKNLRVPPGVYCELAYLLHGQGKAAEANGFFDLEVQTYPESTKFVAFVRSNLNK